MRKTKQPDFLSKWALSEESGDNMTEVADTDQDMSLVDRLRLGGPNAWEVYGEAADAIERLRKQLATQERATEEAVNNALAFERALDRERAKGGERGGEAECTCCECLDKIAEQAP